MVTLILDSKSNVRLLPKPRSCGFSGGVLLAAVSQLIELHADLDKGRFGDMYPGFTAQQCAVAKRAVACVSAEAVLGGARVWACETEEEVCAKVAELIATGYVHEDDARHASTPRYRVDHMDRRERKAWSAAHPL